MSAMQRALALTQSTIGKKALVALTGMVLFGFVIGHLSGNLLVFAGRDAFNHYAETIKGNPPLLWGTRITLVVSVVVHIALTMQLAARNSGARSMAYQHTRRDAITTYAARTMILSGPLLAAYIAFHIAHFTYPGLSLGGQFSHADPYGNFVQSFRVWWVSAIYMFASFLLGLHLYHGGWSLLQSLGLSHPRYNGIRKLVPTTFAVLVSLGNISMPLAVMTRVVGQDV
jgi:succinate dehydrogenase / fumarate reductase, cytochrome b subunit